MATCDPIALHFHFFTLSATIWATLHSSRLTPRFVRLLQVQNLLRFRLLLPADPVGADGAGRSGS